MTGTRDEIQDPSVVTGTQLIYNYTIRLNMHISFINHELRHMLSHKSNRLEKIGRVEMTNELTETTYEILTNCILTHNNYIFSQLYYAYDHRKFRSHYWYELIFSASC